jgi:tetratricopeptide (TPR) repeat protein
VVEALRKADEAFKAERWADAVAQYEKVLALRPDGPVTIHQQIGVAQVHLKDYAKALDHLQKVLDADPLNVPVRVLMAKAALAGGMIDRALGMLATIDDRAIRAPDVFYDIAVHFVNANQPAQAISYFTKALFLDPAYADAYFRRAMARLQIGQAEGAKADLRKVLELKPEGPQADAARDALSKLK